jgi:hypothetical protein
MQLINSPHHHSVFFDAQLREQPIIVFVLLQLSTANLLRLLNYAACSAPPHHFRNITHLILFSSPILATSFSI